MDDIGRAMKWDDDEKPNSGKKDLETNKVSLTPFDHRSKVVRPDSM